MSSPSSIIAVIVIGIVLFIIGFLIGSRRRRCGTHGVDRSLDHSLREDLDRVAGERDEVRERLASLTGDLIDMRESESAKEMELDRLRNEHESQGRELAIIRSEHDELMTVTRELKRANRDLMQASSIQEKALNETTTLLRTFMNQLEIIKGAQDSVGKEQSAGGDPHHHIQEPQPPGNIPPPPPETPGGSD